MPVLIEALGSRDPDVRVAATDSLGRFGRGAKTAIPALKTLRKDSKARVRDRATAR